MGLQGHGLSLLPLQPHGWHGLHCCPPLGVPHPVCLSSLLTLLPAALALRALSVNPLVTPVPAGILLPTPDFCTSLFSSVKGDHGPCTLHGLPRGHAVSMLSGHAAALLRMCCLLTPIPSTSISGRDPWLLSWPGSISPNTQPGSRKTQGLLS